MKSRRERVREAAIDEIKSIAWDIAKTDGTEHVTVNGIARTMGMTPPAFYSYFKSRDQLIQAMIIDAYKSFQTQLIEARDKRPESDAIGRIVAVFIAYRKWAVSNPNMFGLFAGKPVSGFDKKESDIIKEAEIVHDIFIDLFEDALQKKLISNRKKKLELPAEYQAEIERIRKKKKLSLSLNTCNQIIRNGMLVHGMISMEISGRLPVMVGNPALFYQFQIKEMLKGFGIDQKLEIDA